MLPSLLRILKFWLKEISSLDTAMQPVLGSTYSSLTTRHYPYLVLEGKIHKLLLERRQVLLNFELLLCLLDDGFDLRDLPLQVEGGKLFKGHGVNHQNVALHSFKSASFTNHLPVPFLHGLAKKKTRWNMYVLLSRTKISGHCLPGK